MLAILLAFGWNSRVFAQQQQPESTDAKTPEAKALYAEIARMDSALFTAFNNRDLEKLRTFFTGDLEFYHDLGGLSLYAKNMEAFKNMFKSEWKVRRELIPGSLEVYPIKGYGAIEIGTHRFFETGKDGKEHQTSTPKFLHVWQMKDGRWQISRVISYAH